MPSGRGYVAPPRKSCDSTKTKTVYVVTYRVCNYSYLNIDAAPDRVMSGFFTLLSANVIRYEDVVESSQIVQP
jgi:hypothetical protein